jgi:2-polyprenyl-6-methoxyphenol hydroxylase-like FAD-dependent oxidoreductase
MSPFGGDGANLAMQDAAELAQALSKGKDWRAAVRNYEAAMFLRAESSAAGARQAIDEVFSEDGLAHTLQAMAAHRGQSAESHRN